VSDGEGRRMFGDWTWRLEIAGRGIRSGWNRKQMHARGKA